MSRPITIDTSNWKPFDPSDPNDAACERERLAFTDYTVKRLKKASKTGSDVANIWIGGIMAITQMTIAMYDGRPGDGVREALHVSLDHAWLHCMALAHQPTDLN